MWMRWTFELGSAHIKNIAFDQKREPNGSSEADALGGMQVTRDLKFRSTQNMPFDAHGVRSERDWAAAIDNNIRPVADRVPHSIG